MNLPIFGPQHARCEVDGCELRFQCAAGKVVGADPPTERFSGVMIIGEGPGTVELSRRRPFVGPSGRLLDALLASANLPRETVYVTNATLCYPPRADKDDRTPFHQRFPGAVYACLTRLEAEIAAVKPRVIVALGQTALIAVAGYEVKGTRRVPQSCAYCSPEDRKIGPVIACAVGTCDWWAPVVDDDHAARYKAEINNACPKCTASLKRLKPRRIKCPTCGGTKTREEAFTTFAHDHTLGEIAGGLLDARKLPSRLDQLAGVEWIIPTYHPAFCLRAASSTTGKKFGGQYAARAVVEHLEKAARIASGVEPRFDLEIDLTDRAEDVYAYCADTSQPYVIDIETDSEEGAFKVEEIRCVGILRTGQPRALVIDTRSIKRGGLDEHGRRHPLADAIWWFCSNPAIRKVLQNGHYDRTTIWWFWGIPFVAQVGDTQLAHQTLYPDEPHNLGHIGYCMSDVEAWKPPKKRSGALVFQSFEDLCVYNARDLRVTDIASYTMGGDGRGHGRLDTEGTRGAYASDMRLLDFACAMTRYGMPVDRGAIEAIGAEAREAAERTLDAMRDIIASRVGAPAAAAFDPQNPTSLTWALFDKAGPLRMTPAMFTEKTKAPSTAKEALLKITDEPTGFVQALLEHKKYAKIVSTWIEGEGMQVHADSRMRPIWNVARAVTGRWSSSPNFQNWPKDLRAAVVAPPGRVLVGADYSQLEMRIMAGLSGDPELIRRCATADENRKLEPDHDPHSYVSFLTFGETFTSLALEDPAHKKTKPGEPKCKCSRCRRNALRDVAKRVVYGLNYGAGAQTVLAAIYDGGYEGPPISVALIDRVIGVYFKAFPGVPRWRDGALDTARRTREVRSPILGRRRIFPLGDVESTVAYNYPIQSGAADIMNLRLIVLMDALEARFGADVVWLIAQVHDAVYFECDEAIAEEVRAMVEHYLTWSVAFIAGAPEMPFTASAKIARTWKDAA